MTPVSSSRSRKNAGVHPVAVGDRVAATFEGRLMVVCAMKVGKGLGTGRLT